MTYVRTGTCNLCGECCGYPRATDGGQNTVWPQTWPDSLKEWPDIRIAVSNPLLKYFDDMVRKPYGEFKFGERPIHWIWIKNKGLCSALPPFTDDTKYDQRCPFLKEKIDGEARCSLVNTPYKFIWETMCESAPPKTFETERQVQKWFKNCPSCSYVYEVSEDD